jgi:hypothetical protein
MKHIKINGQLLNTEKKWRHLSNKQRDWILSQFREEYILFLKTHRWHPNKTECRQIVERVYEKIEQRGIWISFIEVEKAFSSKLNKYKNIDSEAVL